jgi:hypothetical protein
MTAPKHSPAPWSYAYNPYTVTSEHSPLGVGAEIPAYEILDADANKVFDTNEDTPADLQEANARMGAAAPRLVMAIVECARLLADYDESDGEEGDAYREAVAAITEATGGACLESPKPIVIEVRGGVVQDVLHIPPGYEYEVKDYDNIEADDETAPNPS